jgi:hypothetical protein
MEHQYQGPIEDTPSVEPKSEWVRPEVSRLLAGGAEGSADVSTDGIDIPS